MKKTEQLVNLLNHKDMTIDQLSIKIGINSAYIVNIISNINMNKRKWKNIFIGRDIINRTGKRKYRLNRENDRKVDIWKKTSIYHAKKATKSIIRFTMFSGVATKCNMSEKRKIKIIAELTQSYNQVLVTCATSTNEIQEQTSTPA